MIGPWRAKSSRAGCSGDPGPAGGRRKKTDLWVDKNPTGQGFGGRGRSACGHSGLVGVSPGGGDRAAGLLGRFAGGRWISSPMGTRSLFSRSAPKGGNIVGGVETVENPSGNGEPVSRARPGTFITLDTHPAGGETGRDRPRQHIFGCGPRSPRPRGLGKKKKRGGVWAAIIQVQRAAAAWSGDEKKTGALGGRDSQISSHVAGAASSKCFVEEKKAGHQGGTCCFSGHLSPKREFCPKGPHFSRAGGAAPTTEAAGGESTPLLQVGRRKMSDIVEWAGSRTKKQRGQKNFSAIQGAEGSAEKKTCGPSSE